jgi:hypothetical protein
MTAMSLPPVSPLINVAFNVARAKYRAEHTAWTNLSFILSGRFNLTVASSNIQRQGDLDLLLRCIEDEFEANKTAEIADTTGLDMTFHYQLALSETWVVGCYEILRAFRQRDRDALKACVRPSGVSGMESFKSIFADLELLRMPMTKFEIAKDDKLKEPLHCRKVHRTTMLLIRPFMTARTRRGITLCLVECRRAVRLLGWHSTTLQGGSIGLSAATWPTDC